MGLKDDEYVDTPMRLVLPNKEIPKKVACGSNFCICLTESKKAFGWGANDCSQLGLGEVQYTVEPMEIELPEPLSDIACGHSHTLGVSESGFLYVWGNGENGELGLGNTSDRNVPTLNLCGIIFSKVFGGSSHSLGLTPDGELYGWGWNGYGNMGDGKFDNYLVPQLLQMDIQKVATGGSHVLVLKKNGELWGWGFNGYGHLGTGIKEEVRKPQRIFLSLPDDKEKTELPAEISFIGCGLRHSFVVLRNGDLYSWGDSRDCQTGHPDSLKILSPKKKEGIKLCLPIQDNLRFTFQKWSIAYKWVFLGMVDPDSAFFRIPVEIVFHLFSSTCHNL
jgi:alpha-tubulin suppressor-like RCC1 family protein